MIITRDADQPTLCCPSTFPKGVSHFWVQLFHLAQATTTNCWANSSWGKLAISPLDFTTMQTLQKR